MLRSLRYQYLRNKAKDNRLEEKGVERGSGRRSSFKGLVTAIVNQTNIETVSKATMGKFLRPGLQRIWDFSDRIDTILN